MSTIQKEGELPKVTNLNDNDSIRITLADGRSGSIKKTDLISTFKDALGQLLGNSDPLSLFTNVIVNNDGVLGKATIENLASVVSGANVKTWGINTDLTSVPIGNYLIEVNHPKLDNNDIGQGVGISINVYGYGIQLIQTSSISKRRFSIGKYYYPWINW